jgi:hypothetical protein
MSDAVVMANTLEGERAADYLTRLAASDLGRSYKSLVLNERASSQVPSLSISVVARARTWQH